MNLQAGATGRSRAAGGSFPGSAGEAATGSVSGDRRRTGGGERQTGACGQERQLPFPPTPILRTCSHAGRQP